MDDELYIEVEENLTQEELLRLEEEIRSKIITSIEVYYNEHDGSVVGFGDSSLNSVYPSLVVPSDFFQYSNPSFKDYFNDYKVIFSSEKKEYELIYHPGPYQSGVNYDRIYEIPLVETIDYDVDFTVIQHIDQSEWIFQLHPKLIDYYNNDYYLNSKFIEVFIMNDDMIFRTIQVPYKNLIELKSHGVPFVDSKKENGNLTILLKKQYSTYQHIIYNEKHN